MTKRRSESQVKERPASGVGQFYEGGLWVGRHEADEDLLIFDPGESDPAGRMVSLYSLSQHRLRRFPREVVLARIHPVDDAAVRARAEEDYGDRGRLRDEHSQARTEEAARGRGRQRESVLAQHSRYIESIGGSYEGVKDTDGNHKAGRRTKCHSCGIALDDFAGAICVICAGVLCSCGACACKQRPT